MARTSAKPLPIDDDLVPRDPQHQVTSLDRRGHRAPTPLACWCRPRRSAGTDIFWVLIAPENHVLYRYPAAHDGAAVDAILAGYEGYLVADAHAVYDHLFRSGKVIEVACWAHARRYWFKAPDSEPERARVTLGLIGELFRIERAATELPARERLAVRGRESWPVVDKFFTWCKSEAPRALDDTPLAKALGYALNQRAALEHFLEDGRLPLQNNGSEQALRREVIGRKNWLFVGNDEAAEVNAAFVSLLASCRMHSVEPWAYLRDLFCLVPSWPARRVLELAPVNRRQTCQQQDTQQRLAANVYRLAVLDSPSIATTSSSGPPGGHDAVSNAISFFAELGLELEGRATIEGEWAGRVTGLRDQRVEIAMMRTPDGHSRLELSRFLTPPVVADHRNAPVNALGYLRVMFTVEDIDDTLARLRKCGAQLVGEVVQYEDAYRLCYIRGPEGLLIGLAQELG